MAAPELKAWIDQLAEDEAITTGRLIGHMAAPMRGSSGASSETSWIT
jgi:hypothetical protein